MINVIRETEIPISLTTKEIQDYILGCIQYLNDPNNNSKPEITESYRNSDLIEAFDRCFYSKCYLTEEKFFNSWKMDVEHFISKNERPDLVYEWTNLYPAEHKANMSKPRSTPNGGYLDPCNINDDVESEIIYTLIEFGSIPNFTERDCGNQKQINTANLLNRLHNGHNQLTKLNTSDLRNAIQKKYIKILEKICEWRALSFGSQEEIQKRNEIRLLLSRESSFTMLCRSIPAVIQLNNQFPNMFFD